MNFYDDLVMQTQMNYSRHYHIYASGGTPYQLTDKKPLPYSEQIHRLVQEVKEADCVVVWAGPPACPLPVVEIFTTRTTTLTANTSALLPRSTTSKVLLQG